MKHSIAPHNRLTKPFCTPRQLVELRQFFRSCSVTSEIQLASGWRIINVKSFAENHILAALRNRYKRTYQPYFHRLLEVKKHIESQTIKQ